MIGSGKPPAAAFCGLACRPQTPSGMSSPSRFSVKSQAGAPQLLTEKALFGNYTINPYKNMCKILNGIVMTDKWNCAKYTRMDNHFNAMLRNCFFGFFLL
jgi:hypothetical protein